jgi:Ni,Fe-hydrogenase III small subunit/formate hydrogenlyase subunit 6/NADH:ubiquinone oxidoreductase subunit I
MLDLLRTRLRQGHRTISFPAGPPPEMPDRFRGRPVIDPQRCPPGCHACTNACPTGAIVVAESGAESGRESPTIDLGRCLFCTDCTRACQPGAIHLDKDYRLAARKRQDLLVPANAHSAPPLSALDGELKRLLGRSLKLRQVSAGGCNACEADTNVLNTIGWDLGRFGIQFVASPRHADGLLITGPVTANMALALRKTYDAVSKPKIVIAVGACAISGGPYIDHVQDQARGQHIPSNGADAHLPVDLYIPGCPPHPLTILDGLLRLLGK